MSSLQNGNALLASALSGLSNTYSILAQNSKNKNGLTIEEITNPSTTVLQQLGNNTTFAQFLSSNFAAIDKDGDGAISSTDMSNLTNTICFNIDNFDSTVIADILNREFSIAVRPGYHCAYKAHEVIGTRDIGAVRVSVSYFNKLNEIQFLKDAIYKISKREY